MTTDEMIEVLEQIQVPGATGEWQHEEGHMIFNAQEFENIIEDFHRRGLFFEDDPIANTIRCGAMRFIGDAMCAWEDCLDDIPVEAQTLWDACNDAAGDAAALPWRLFSDAFPWLLYHAPEAFWWGAVNDERYYDVDVDITYDDTLITVQIGAGWADLWTINYDFPIPDTREELVEAINKGLPYYMRVLE